LLSPWVSAAVGARPAIGGDIYVTNNGKHHNLRFRLTRQYFAQSIGGGRRALPAAGSAQSFRQHRGSASDSAANGGGAGKGRKPSMSATPARFLTWGDDATAIFAQSVGGWWWARGDSETATLASIPKASQSQNWWRDRKLRRRQHTVHRPPRTGTHYDDRRSRPNGILAQSIGGGRAVSAAPVTGINLGAVVVGGKRRYRR